MPRANRYHVPGLIWHITHRCHKREYLLKFARDRQRWQYWLFEARRRFGLQILNFTVTCNHVHLLVVEDDNSEGVCRGLQLVAGRTAQEYNQRKSRGGAFWEDRYHATAVESGEHLRRCMAYIDLNMFRTGAVDNPGEWPDCGYQGIQRPPKRYRLLDLPKAATLLGCSGEDSLRREQQRWVKEGLLSVACSKRDGKWSDSLAVGSQTFVETVASRLGLRARFRNIAEKEGDFILREARSAYDADYEPKMFALTSYMSLNHE